jgi:hypothetical protein
MIEPRNRSIATRQPGPEHNDVFPVIHVVVAWAIAGTFPAQRDAEVLAENDR